MAVLIKNEYGNIEISTDVIATVVGGATTEIFGVVGMASKNQLRDNVSDILKKENYARGVVIQNESDSIVVDVYVIVSYGTKISEVSRNVQERVAYQLEATLGLQADSVNVYVQGVRVMQEN